MGIYWNVVAICLFFLWGNHHHRLGDFDYWLHGDVTVEGPCSTNDFVPGWWITKNQPDSVLWSTLVVECIHVSDDVSWMFGHVQTLSFQRCKLSVATLDYHRVIENIRGWSNQNYMLWVQYLWVIINGYFLGVIAWQMTWTCLNIPSGKLT